MGYVFLALALSLNAGANLLLKAGAVRFDLQEGPLLMRAVTNPWLVAGVTLFALNVAFYVAALQRLDLSVAYPVMAAGGMLIVVSASVFVLREQLTHPQLVGVVLLTVGMALVAGRGAP